MPAHHRIHTNQGASMKRLFSARPLAAAAIALGAVGAASVAHARSDVFLSIGIPGGYVQPAPVYVQPQPIYVQPRSYYVQPQPIYYGQQYGHVRRHGPYGDADRDGIANRWDRDYSGRQGRHEQRFGAYGDRDRDGVSNRHDRFPENPYRR
jgi:hypothetical protein